MDFIEEMQIVRVEGDTFQEIEDPVVKEFPLTLRINGAEQVTIACSPANLEELAVGYLFSEGVIKSRDDIASLSIEEDRLEIQLAVSQERRLDHESVLRHKVITSGCGRSTIFTDLNGTGLKKVRDNCRINHQVIFTLGSELSRGSEIFKETGGVHSGLLADLGGRQIVFREDIGRHNAVDKIVGYLVIENCPATETILVVSGRISAEMVLKAARREIPILASRSAPTDQAIRLAYRLGITLIGFVRGKRMNIYTHVERVI